MRSSNYKRTFQEIVARHPRPWTVIDESTSVDADGNVVEIDSLEEEFTILVAATEALNRLDVDDLADVTIGVPETV